MADIHTRYHEQTLLITISRTAVTDLDADVFVNGVEILNEAERDADVRSIVLTGDEAGLGAQSGAALSSLQLAERAAWLEGLHSLVESVATFPKPTLALLQGQTAGSGLALALACDMLVAAPSARILLQADNRQMQLLGGVSWHLAHRVPHGIAMQLLAGEKLGAERLHASGFVSHLTQADTPLHTALQLAESLHQWPAAHWQHHLELLHQARQTNFYQQLQREREAALRLQR